MNKLVVISIIAFGILGCKASTSPEDIVFVDSPIPLAEGNKWVYQTTIFENGELIEEKMDSLIIGSYLKDGSEPAWLISEETSWAFGMEGIIQYSSPDTISSRKSVLNGEWEYRMDEEFVFPKVKGASLIYDYWLGDISIPRKSEYLELQVSYDGEKYDAYEITEYKSFSTSTFTILDGLGITKYRIDATYSDGVKFVYLSELMNYKLTN